MSDDTLKSKDEKPTSRKSRQSTTRITAATKTPDRTTAPERNTVKVKGTATAKKQPVAVKKSETKNKVTPTNPKLKTTDQNTTDKTVDNTTQEKASEKVLKNKNKNKKTPPEKDGPEQDITEKDVVKLNSLKDKKPLESSTKAKIESEPVSRPRKNKSITKMASVAAILFLGVLFVFLLGRDPASVEGQTASTTPSTTAALPNPNASSPYGMRVEQLKEIEVLLAVLNFDPGNIDGDIDHETVAAISLFQQISGIEVDGHPSPTLLVELKAVDELLNK